MPTTLTILLLCLAAALAIGWLTSCGGETGSSSVPSPSSAAWLDGDRYLGEPLQVANLTVWPVHTKAPLDVGEFLTLAEAQEREVAVVREVGGAGSNDASEEVQQVTDPAPQSGIEVPQAEEPASEPDESEADGVQQLARQVAQTLNGEGGAVVDTLVIENRGDLPILVCAGTMVKGGKQDRQIGQDFVVQAGATVPVDAFCVEPGRWSARAEGGLAFSSLAQIAPKAVRESAQYEMSQQAVWNEVGTVLRNQGVTGTDTLVAAVEQAQDDTREERERVEKTVLAHFGRLQGAEAPPVGFAYAVEGKPVTVRAFAHERLLEGHLPAFAKAMAMEADLALRSRDEGAAEPPPATAADVVAMVEAIAQAEEQLQETSAGNWNGYRKGAAGYNGNCYLPNEEGKASERVITVDWTAK